MVWIYQDDQLYGLIRFEEDIARIEAYGHDTSRLLSGYEDATFTYSFEDGFLTLVNEQSGVQLPYTILESSKDEILMSYLDEIVVRLYRTSN